MNKMIKCLVAVSLLAVNATVSALDFSISGAGTTQTQGDSKDTNFGADLRLEEFVFPTISVGVVQGLSYGEVPRFATELFLVKNLDWKLGKFNNTVFAGGFGRVSYGEGATTWVAGPVVGNRFFLKENVYVLTQVNYDVNLHSAKNGVRYSVGLGVRF